MTLAKAAQDRAGSDRVASFDRDLLPWLAVLAASVAAFALVGELPWLKALPAELLPPISDWINVAMAAFVDSFKWLFRAVNWLLDWPMWGLQEFLHWLPWPAAICLVAMTAYAAGGAGLATFSAVALLYMVVIGDWDESMATLSLVGVSVPLSLLLGSAIGILGFKSRLAARIIQPMLDFMQTMPTFAYLIPILLLFGFGQVVGLIASTIYAAPCMTRNVMLGLRRVSTDVLEAGQIMGCTRRQLLWRVQIPTAMPTLMLGVNQTIMAALSMVIIASVIGGFDDIGWELLSTLRKAQFGQSLVSGLVLALIAMVLDRISSGFAKQQFLYRPRQGSLWQRYRTQWIALGIVAAWALLAQVLPALRTYPEGWILQPAGFLNKGVDFILQTCGVLLGRIKDQFLLFLLLPLRNGLAAVATPKLWGFSLTPPLIALYAALVLGLAFAGLRRVGWRLAVTVVILGVFYFFGAVNIPWLAAMLALTLFAYQVAGWRVAIFAALAALFILLTGSWREAMLSFYLCVVAVFISGGIGVALGIWSALDDRVSAFLRPINDTLQTMPQFVFLIPAVMFFKVGEFPALLAMVSYAVVPSIRYTEHGIRQVRNDLIEAARAMGCTRPQILWRVQLPLAMPEIMLGVNQTILFGITILAVAALVGTRELGQLIYNALTNADAGKGFVAGFSMALIAMVADRIAQAWATQRKEALGLA
jgi:glycine betaine/proline transport system permease protein